ncbi:MAG: GNAT family N-acetyltransferase [Bacteroidota bacterium]
MNLKHRFTNQYLKAKILEVSREDYKRIKRDNGFSFNWDIEKSHKTCKIFLLSDQESILGLMSLVDRPDEYRIHLNRLEVVRSQQGKEKQIDNIAGCLIAFAASLAVKKGYNGFVSLEPKTELIDHYQNKYGFRQYGRYLAVEGSYSNQLIDKYLSDE